MKELAALRRQLSNEQTASFYADRFFTSIANNKDAEKYFYEIVVSTIERYKELDEIKEKVDQNSQFDQLLTMVLRLFPTYSFIICNELDKRPDYYEFSQSLRICVTASSIARRTDFQSNALAFLNSLDSGAKLDQLDFMLENHKTVNSYLPGILNKDLKQLISTHPKLKTTTSPHELVEIAYYFKAIKQIFLKYYFYLIGQAQNDIIAVHINRIFSRLLFSIRQQESKYWNKYKNGKKLYVQLMASIAKDMAKSRHPHLRKHVFDAIDKINPVIQNGTLNSTVIEVRQLLMKQLAIFYDLSVNKLVLMLDTTLKTESSEHVVYLLTQLSRTNIEKLFDLHDHLDSLPSDKTKSLQHLVVSFSSKLPGAKRRLHDEKKDTNNKVEIHKTIESVRTVHAKKRLIETEGKRGMTHEQVPRFLEERLKKLYEKAKKAGALTQDRIPEYLARFAALAEMIVNPIPKEKQTVVVEEFQTATEELLDDISSEGQLTDQEVKEFRKDIREKYNELDTPDVDTRTEIVDEIGVTLTEASFESDKRKQNNDIEAFFSRSLIPYGLDKKAKKITIYEFFQFPFGDFNGPKEEDWFNFHMRYLQLAVKEKKFDKSSFVKIFNLLSRLPKIKYKKYFNIFPNDQFEETTFMAVYDLWQNKAFEKLRLD